MATKNYSDLLKSPKWQKKRLEILNRDGFRCSKCGDEESTLHVHHRTYIKEFKPWDYQNDNYITLCESCHADIHNPIKVTDNSGIIDPSDFLKVAPDFSLYFSEIGNHEGVWTLKARTYFDYNKMIFQLGLLIGYAWFDCQFEIYNANNLLLIDQEVFFLYDMEESKKIGISLNTIYPPAD